MKPQKKNKPASWSAAHARKKRAADQSLRGFTLKFLVVAVLTVISVSIVPEAWYTPLTRITAFLSGELLRVLTLTPMVQGTRLTLGRFSVNIIAECTAVYLVALFGAFVFAFPAGRARKWIGFCAGTAVLLAANVLRIGLVTWIGRQWPGWFEPAHVYLGQLGMLVLMVVVCLVWCRYTTAASHGDGALSFLLRFIAFSSPLFLLWLPFNKIYMGVVDDMVQWLFYRASHQSLVIPRAHQLYYQTFALVSLVGMLLAVKGIDAIKRMRWIGCGIGISTLLLLIFRLCNAWMTAFGLQWMASIAQLAHAFCVYALPVAMVLRLIMMVRPGTTAASS